LYERVLKGLIHIRYLLSNVSLHQNITNEKEKENIPHKKKTKAIHRWKTYSFEDVFEWIESLCRAFSIATASLLKYSEK